MLYAIFFDSKGPVLQIPVPKGSSVTRKFYRESVLTQLVDFYTTQNLLRITFSFNDLMLKTNRLKKDFFYKDRLIFGRDDPVANMSIRHVYYA